MNKYPSSREVPYTLVDDEDDLPSPYFEVLRDTLAVFGAMSLFVLICAMAGFLA